MPLKLVRDDLLRLSPHVDAIVNPTDKIYSGGGHLDMRIHLTAGPELTLDCDKLPPLAVGKAEVTPGYRLGCRYVLHTRGPVWEDGKHGEEELLISSYKECLRLATRLGCRSVAFPLISSGTFRYPKDKVLRVAMNAITGFLSDEYDALSASGECAPPVGSGADGEPDDLMVYLVIYDKEAYRLGSGLVAGIEQRIQDAYVDQYAAFDDMLIETIFGHAYLERERLEGLAYKERRRAEERDRLARGERPAFNGERPDAEKLAALANTLEDLLRVRGEASTEAEATAPEVPLEEQAAWAEELLPPEAPTVKGKAAKGAELSAPAVKGKVADAAELSAPPAPRRATDADRTQIDRILEQRDEGFREMLLRLIGERGIKDSAAYKAANVSRGLFNRIVNRPEYRPGKQIVLAFAAGLCLTMEETEELMQKAGLAFTARDPFDIIVRYCLENRIYDVDEINMILFSYDRQLLGSGSRE